MVSKIS